MLARVVLAALATLFVANAVAVEESVEWTYDIEKPAAAPTLYPDAAHPTGVVIVSGNKVILLDGKGVAVWVAELPEVIGTPAAVADIDGDGAAEVVCRLQTGPVICLDAHGQTRWTCPLPGLVGSFKLVTAADVLPESGLEVLTGDETGWLTCLSSRGGVLWRFFGDKHRAAPVAVGDADKDGAPEIVYGTDDGHIYCLTGAGRVKWRFWEKAPYGRSGANLADLDGDGRVELLITRSNTGNATCLMALDAATGKFLWRTKDVMQGYVSNATVDIDGDGKLETLHTDKGNWVYCVNADGSERWRTELGGHGIFWTPVVGDLDGDGRNEVVVGSRNADPKDKACVFVLRDDGSVYARLAIGSGANSGMALGDIDGDGELEVIIPTEGPLRVQALTWNGKGKAAWASVRGDSAMAAAANTPAGAPVSPARDMETGTVRIADETAYWGKNAWQIAWDTPAPGEAFLEVVSTPEDGAAETRIVPIKPGLTECRAEWTAAANGPHTVSLRLAASNAASPLFGAARHVKLRPPADCGMDAVQAGCAAAISAGAASDTRAISERLGALQGEQNAVLAAGEAGETGATLAARATRLREHAAAVRMFAAALTEFWRDGGTGSFVVWQDANPWDTFDRHEIPDAFPKALSLSVAAYGDEYEDVALTLLNVTAEAIDVRCMFAAPSLGQTPPQPEAPLAQHVSLRRAVAVPSAASDAMVNDALPELDVSRTLTLAPGAACQLWLVVDTHGLEPGKHALTLHLGSLEVKPTFRQIPVTIDVWPVRLPEGVLARMNWTTIDIETAPDQQVADMIAHGNSVSYASPLPAIPVDAEGRLAGNADWSRVDATLARVPDYWIVLLPSPPPVRWPEGINPEPDSPLWEEGFKTGVRVLAEHLKSVGWDYDRWAFYPIDEPWLTGETNIPALRRFCTLVKAADPNARNYADPAGNVRVEKIAAFKDLIDVWQPEINLLKRDPELLEWFQNNARSFWVYEATDPGKDLLPLGYYRCLGWLSWLFKLDGFGYWCYQHQDLWWPITGGDWAAVYETNELVIPSRRWEATRDGLDDYRAFYVLDQEIAKAKQEGRIDEAVHAQTLIDEAVREVAAWQIDTIDEITRQTRDYEIDFNLLCDYRIKIMQEIVRLRGIAPTP